MAALEQPQRFEYLSHDARHSCFSRTGIADKYGMQRKFIEHVFSYVIVEAYQLDQFVDLVFDIVYTNQENEIVAAISGLRMYIYELAEKV